MFGQEWRRHSAFSGQRTNTRGIGGGWRGWADWLRASVSTPSQSEHSVLHNPGSPDIYLGLENKKKKEIQIIGLKWKKKHLISAGTEQRRPNSSGLLWENYFWPESASRLACLYKKPTGFQSLCKTIQQRLSGRFCVLLGWTLTSMLQSIYPSNYNLPATNNIICNPVDVFAKKKVNWCTVCLSFWCFASDSTHASLLG